MLCGRVEGGVSKDLGATGREGERMNVRLQPERVLGCSDGHGCWTRRRVPGWFQPPTCVGPWVARLPLDF